MKNDSIDIGKLISEETEKRLESMSDPNYQWPPKADFKDAIAIIVSILISGTLIALCMTGVII